MWPASSLGAQDYTIIGRLNGKPSAVIAVYQLPGSNAVQAAAGVRKLMAEAKKRFPTTWTTPSRWTRRGR